MKETEGGDGPWMPSLPRAGFITLDVADDVLRGLPCFRIDIVPRQEWSCRDLVRVSFEQWAVCLLSQHVVG